MEAASGGGQWPVLGALIARHYGRMGNQERAVELIDWVISTADSALLLPEQSPAFLAPASQQEWIDRWGPSAHPLLWSHGAFLAGVCH